MYERSTAIGQRPVLLPLPRAEDLAHPIETPAFTPRAVRLRRLTAALITSDVAALVIAVALATYIAGSAVGDGLYVGWSMELAYGAVFLVAILAAALSMHRSRLYDPDRLGWGSGEFTKAARGVSTGVVTLVVVPFALGMTPLSREWALLVLALGVVFAASGRGLLRVAESRLLQRFQWLQRPTLIVGSNGEAAELTRLLQANPKSGLVPVGCLRSSHKDTLSLDFVAPMLCSLGSARQLPEIVRDQNIDTVIIIATAFDYEVIQRMVRELKSLPVNIQVSTGLSEVLCSRVVASAFAGVPLLSVKSLPLSKGATAGKRAFDLVVSGLIIALGTPIWAGLAALIKLTSKGPVFYKQERIGLHGTPFLMYKFRSMVADADKHLEELRAAQETGGGEFYKPVSDYGCKICNDPRITPIGRWMRKFSIDEFPQLLNVVRGEMSLVGPRPPVPREVLHYTPQDWRRLEVVPGMTGLWQVSGRAGLTFRETVRLDVFYIDNWSLGFDISLLARTPAAVLFARGAC